MIAQSLSTDILVQAAQDVFDTMVFMKLEPITERHQIWTGDILLGTITFHGAAEGCLGLCCPKEAAEAITQSMLGMAPGEALEREDIQDALGEVTNMVMGNLKTLLADILGDLQISVPTVMRGQQFDYDISDKAQRLYLGANVGEAYPVELSFFWRQ
jgi:chemotaxis protein CheX